MNQAEEIKNKLDIVDVAREYIPLKAAGANFKANCPFHSEKTASLMISPEKQIFHCFGCGKGGDVITFVQEIEGLDFMGALRLLAPKAGVVLKDGGSGDYSKKNKLLNILDLASKYYHKSLINTDSGKKMIEYLNKRGLEKETIDYWRIGYSQNSWEDLYMFLLNKGYSEQEILEAGLILRKQKGGGSYNRFRDRIMFPILDINSNTVAFTGRVNPYNKDSDKGGKYINSPETDLFFKSKILYGMDKAKMDIKEKDFAIIVEGQMDVIMVNQAGLKNVVASSGTALTNEQLNIIKRYTNNIYLCFDMDKAGQMAADRGIVEALKLEMNIKVIILPEGKDPADLILVNKELFKKAVNEAKPMMQYYLDKTLAENDISKIEGKRKATVNIVNILSKMINKVEKDFWLKKSATFLDISETILKEMIEEQLKKDNKYSGNKYSNDKYSNLGSNISNSNLNKEKKVEQFIKEEGREIKLTKIFLAILTRFPELISYAVSNLELKEVFGEGNKEFYNQLIIYYNKNNNIDFSSFKNWLETNDFNLNNLLIELSILGEKDFYNFNQQQAKIELVNIIMEIKSVYKHFLMKKMEREISSLEAQGKSEEANNLLQELQNLMT